MEKTYQQIVILPIFLLIIMVLAVAVGKLTLGLLGIDSYVGGFVVGAAICALVYSMYLSWESSDHGTSVIAVDPNQMATLEEVLEAEEETGEISDVSEMTPESFQDLVGELLAYQGLRVEKNEKLAQFGFQFRADRRGKTYAVRVIHGKQLLSHGMVESIIRARSKTDCGGVVIVTDGLFSEEAHELADKEHFCKLADKDVLERWLSSFRQAGRAA